MLRTLDRVMAAASGIAVAAGAISLAAACILILLEVVLRNFFGTTTGVSVEYSTYFFVFLTFAALARTQASGSMIYMEIGYDNYPRRLQRPLNALRWTLGLVFGVVATYYLYTFTARTCSLGQVSMFPSRTPLCWPQSVLVAGMGFLTLEYLRGTIVAWHDLFAGSNDAAPEPGDDVGEIPGHGAF